MALFVWGRTPARVDEKNVSTDKPLSERPIRVVMFGSGPALTHEARRFLFRLETDPEIKLLGAYCQADTNESFAVVKDLWKRRGILAAPLLVLWYGRAVMRLLRDASAESELRRVLAGVSDRIHFVKDIHAQEVLDEVALLAPDLGLVYGSPILKPALFEIPALGTLGIHHGKVPQYRGNKTTFWALYNGEDVAGVTIQKINRGLDTGQIVKEGEVTIGNRSLGSVSRALETLGLDLYIRAILEVKAGTATFSPQSGTKGKLYHNPEPRDFLAFAMRRLRQTLSRLERE